MAKNEYMCDCDVIHQDSVDIALSKMPKEQVFTSLANFYKLIGDQTRCKILFAIDQHEMCVCDLANTLSMSKSSVSHQLSKLKEFGIVKSRKEKKEVYYTLDDEHVTEVFEIGLEHIKHKENK